MLELIEKLQDPNLEIRFSESAVLDWRIGGEEAVRAQESEDATESNSEDNGKGDSRSDLVFVLVLHQRPVSTTQHSFFYSVRDFLCYCIKNCGDFESFGVQFGSN